MKWRSEPEMTTVEFDMGPTDLLIITFDRELGSSVIDRVREDVRAILKREGKVSMVLEKGTTVQIIPRPWLA